MVEKNVAKFKGFLNALESAEKPSSPKVVGRGRGRPPKPKEEQRDGCIYTVNGRRQRGGKKYDQFGRLKKKYRKNKKAIRHKSVLRARYRRVKDYPSFKAYNQRKQKKMKYQFLRYKRKIKHRHPDLFSERFSLTQADWEFIWDNSEDVFCKKDLKLKRPIELKGNMVSNRGTWFTRIDKDGPWSRENCAVFFEGRQLKITAPKEE